MPSPLLPFLVVVLLFSSACALTVSKKCASRAFTKNRLYSTCVDLPHLSAQLHSTYDPPTSMLRLAFAAPPTKPGGGWVAWGINPRSTGMVGSQSLVGYRQSDGSVVAKTSGVHGLLNAVSWRILLPVGAIVGRGMKTFNLTNPAWFYLHVSCQIIGYAVEVAGWATSFSIGSKSKGVVKTHKSVGTVVFSLGITQVLAVLLKPRKEHKYRPYWELCHQAIGYAAIVMRVVNVFKGLDILKPDQKWRTGYIVVVSVLCITAVALEAINLVMRLRRKKSTNAAEPNDGASNDHEHSSV